MEVVVFGLTVGFGLGFPFLAGILWFFLADSLLVSLGLSLSLLVPSFLINSFVGLYASCFSVGHGWPRLCSGGLRCSEPRGWLWFFFMCLLCVCTFERVDTVRYIMIS